MRPTLLSVLSLLLVAFLAHPALAETIDNPWLDRELSAAELMPSVEQGADYLLRNQLAGGQFVYINDPLGKCCTKKGDKYSVIRHLGAVYALLRAYEMTHAKAYLAGAKAGIEFAMRFRDPDAKNVLRGLKGQTSIGENGFMLIDAVLYNKLSGQPTFASVADDMAAFVETALEYDGPYSTRGQWAECQALIGLMQYFKNGHPEKRYLAVARRWLDAMRADQRHSHWSIQAIQAFADVSPELDKSFTDYAIKGGHDILDQVVIRGPVVDRRRIGARQGKFLSCNSTARSEGLVSSHILAKRQGNQIEAGYFLDRVKEHIAFAMQFQFGQLGNLFENNPEMTRISDLFGMRGGLFNDPNQAFVRIDFVAHHIRAIGNYLNSGSAPASHGLTRDEISH